MWTYWCAVGTRQTAVYMSIHGAATSSLVIRTLEHRSRDCIIVNRSDYSAVSTRGYSEIVKPTIGYSADVV